jgi:hypothetical protein
MKQVIYIITEGGEIRGTTKSKEIADWVIGMFPHLTLGYIVKEVIE